MKEYSCMITLDKIAGQEYTHDDIKHYIRKCTICEAKKRLKKLVKITGLNVGELTVFNENCTVRYVYTYNVDKFVKTESWPE